MVTIVEKDVPQDWYDYIIYRCCSIGVDVETTGLDKTWDKLAMVQLFVPGKGTLFIRRFQDFPIRLMSILENIGVKKIFHHALFDLTFLMRDFHVKARNVACTKVAAKILDPNKQQYASHALKHLLKEILDVYLDKSIATSDWLGELSAEQIDYAEKDVLYLPDLLYELERQLANRQLLQLARESFIYLPTYVALEFKNYRDVFGY